MRLFKKRTRAQDIKEYADGITSSIINASLSPSEILEIHEKVTANIISELEKEKSRLIIESKRINAEYKKTSEVLTKIRISRDALETPLSK